MVSPDSRSSEMLNAVLHFQASFSLFLNFISLLLTPVFHTDLASDMKISPLDLFWCATDSRAELRQSYSHHLNQFSC